MGFKLKSGNTSSFKNMGSSPAKQKVDPDAPGTPGTPGYEPPVTSMDYLTKTPVGPVATKKKVKKETPGDVKLDPGFEDPIKIQELQRKGLTPDSQKFMKRKKSPAKPAVRPKFKSPAKQKDFNKTGSKASTTPGYSTTKAAKTQNFRNAANKIKTVSSKTNKGSKVINALKNTPKQYIKPAKEILKTTNRNMISASKQVAKNFNMTGTSKAGKFAKVAKKVVKKAAIPSLKAVTTGLGYGTGAMAAFDLLTGPAAILGLAAHGAYKSGQKHSGGKAVKGQKSFMADAKKNTKSIYKKK